MGMLDGLIGQIATQAITNQLGGGQQQSGGLGGLVGSVLGGGQQQSGGLGGLVGSMLGGGQQQQGVDVGSILGSVLGGGNKSNMMVALMPLVLGWIQRNGGLSQAFDQLQKSGLADAAGSWMGTGANQSIGADIIGNLIGNNEIASFAQQNGMDVGSVQSGLSQLLPEVLNQLTPQGGLQDEAAANVEIGDLLNQFSSLMK